MLHLVAYCVLVFLLTAHGQPTHADWSWEDGHEDWPNFRALLSMRETFRQEVLETTVSMKRDVNELHIDCQTLQDDITEQSNQTFHYPQMNQTFSYQEFDYLNLNLTLSYSEYDYKEMNETMAEIEQTHILQELNETLLAVKAAIDHSPEINDMIQDLQGRFKNLTDEVRRLNEVYNITGSDDLRRLNEVYNITGSAVSDNND